MTEDKPATRRSNPDHRTTARTNSKTASAPSIKATPKPATKQAAVVALLSRKNGVSIEELIKATDWQAHSIRGFLSGTIGKKLGLKLTSSTDAAGKRRYAISR